MIAIEPLSPGWQRAFLESRNSVFTPINEDYLADLAAHEAEFPTHTWICRDAAQVVSWATFYLRRLHLGPAGSPALRFAQACAIGTLPTHQRRGLGRKTWLAAEKGLAAEADGILVYTDEGGDGDAFYRSLGYLPLDFPAWLVLAPGAAAPEPSPSAADQTRITTAPFVPNAQASAMERGRIFSGCYADYIGYLADRPRSLETWARVSSFYRDEFTGATPMISWLTGADGRWKAYAIWAGPLQKIAWKNSAVELWEVATTPDCGAAELRALLQPALAACPAGESLHTWTPAGHPLHGQMLALGFKTLPRSLCVLGKIFNAERHARARLQAQTFATDAAETTCRAGRGGRLEFSLDGMDACLERDSAQRLLFGRSNATTEHLGGMLTFSSATAAPAALRLMDRAFPRAPWAYLASEFI